LVVPAQRLQLTLVLAVPPLPVVEMVQVVGARAAQSHFRVELAVQLPVLVRVLLVALDQQLALLQESVVLKQVLDLTLLPVELAVRLRFRPLLVEMLRALAELLVPEAQYQ
jgi:hypothetical protein